jgi:hypothetical protein
LYGVILGAVVGVIWALALASRVGAGVVAGAVAGLVLGLIVAIFGKMARAGSNLKSGETSFVSSAILTLLAVVGSAVGLLFWLGRVLFF